MPASFTLHDDNILFLGLDSRQLHGSLDSFGTGIPEKERIQRWMGHNRKQSLYEIQVRFVKRYADLLRILSMTQNRPCSRRRTWP